MNLRQLMALLCSELMILLPLTTALSLSHDGNPAEQVTNDGAVIVWYSDEASTSVVEYGLSPEARDTVEEVPDMVTEHRVHLGGLEQDTTYFFGISSTNEYGENASSHSYGTWEFQFTTDSGPDILPPEFTSDITVKQPSNNTIDIEWSSNEDATSLVYYGTTDALGQKAYDNSYVTAHSVSLEVSTDTVYYYKAGMCDRSDNCANSSIKTVVVGSDPRPPFVEAEIPEYHRSRFLDVVGTSKAQAEINLYVNGQLARWTTANADGNWNIQDVALNRDASNTIRVEATDQNGATASKEYTVTVDSHPPLLELDEIPETASSSSFSVSGTVDELVTLSFLVTSEKDLVAPSQADGLRTEKVGTNSVRLLWDANPEDDLWRYAMYRDGIRLTTTRETSFTDSGSTVNSGRTYTYEVSAVDGSCNEGEKSDPLEVTTVSGGQVFNNEPEAVNLSCSKHTFSKSIKVQGQFSEAVTLEQGINHLIIEATDRAGNSVKSEHTILYDTKAPKIIEHNLNEITPTYSKEVTIQGKVSEPATVLIFINDDSDPAGSTETDEEGNFKVDVTLRRDIAIDYWDREIEGLDVTETRYKFGDAWKNTVRIVAIDSVGLRDETEPVEVILAQCGYGSWWRVGISEPTPDMLTPRLILEGMSMIGIAVNISWQGGDYNGTIRDVDLRFQPLSVDELEDWDTNKNGWVTVKYIPSNDKKRGYALLSIPAQDPARGKNWTIFEKEENISNHRLGECGVPGFGCVKVPLMLVIDFETPDYNSSQQQRQCWDVMVTIDRRIPPDKIPEGLLETSIELLEATIEVIDAILEPMRTVKEYVFYACAATWVLDFFSWFKQEWSCTFTGGLAGLLDISGTKKMKQVASVGRCEEVYCPKGQQCDEKSSSKKDSCEQCMNAMKSRLSIERNMHWLCDRIFCPSVPTLERFMEQQYASDPPEKIEGTNLDSGSSCAVIAEKKRQKDGDVILSTKEVYDIYQEYEEDKNKAEGAEDSCVGLHPADEKCCGQEYMDQWDAACLVMNELKENVCYLGEYEAQLEELEAGGGEYGEGINCPITWNKVADICAPKGEVQTYPVDSQMFYKDYDEKDKDHIVNEKCLLDTLKKEDDYKVWFTIVPPNNVRKDKDFKVYRGYMLTRMRVADINQDPANKDNKYDDILMNKELVFRIGRDLGTERKADVTDYFFIPGRDKEGENPKKGEHIVRKCTSNPYCKSFMESMMPECVRPRGDMDLAFANLYNDIQSKIGYREKDYIVDPTSGFLRSVQCACLSAVTGYLSLYRNMAMAVKNCFQTILVTGDGSSGLCRAVLTVYVCDLIYDIISCAMQKFGGSYHREKGASIGNFFGALTSAGSGVQRSIAGRYGSSAIWESMFAERRIVHSLCLFAFTGTWDLDIADLIEQDFTTPVKSEGFLYPCERRFISFNPVSRPSGLTSWNYHFGVGLIAGADLQDIRLSLVCSDDFSCNPVEGFVNGRCDCQGGKDTRTLAAGIPNTLNSGDMIFEEGDIYVTLQNNKVRYDKAVLSWSYIDNNNQRIVDEVECKLGQVGGKPPAFCEWDAGSFRCELNLGSEMWAHFEHDPVPLYPSNTNAFSVNDQVKFDVEIQQQIPDDMQCDSKPNCEYTKYLKMWITNQNGYVVSEYNELLNEDGKWRETVNFGLLRQEDFGATGTGIPTVTGLEGADSNDIIATANPDASTVDFHLKIVEENGVRMYYAAYSRQFPQGGTKEGRLSKTANEEIEYDKIKVTIKPSAKGLYFIHFSKGSTTDVCSSTAQAQTWHGYFEIYDARENQNGKWEMSPQLTVYEGELQKKHSIRFQALCRSGGTGGCEGPTKMIMTECSCGGVPHCQAGSYCIDGVCLELPENLRGCNDKGDGRVPWDCVCNGTEYEKGEGGGVCKVQDQVYCRGDVCSKYPPEQCTADCSCLEKSTCEKVPGKCSWSDTDKKCIDLDNFVVV